MGRHNKPDAPLKPNELLDIGAAPGPIGESIELAVVVRLEDNSYRFKKIVPLEEYQFTLDGLTLALQTAQYRVRAQALRAAHEASNPTPVPDQVVPTPPAPQPPLPPHLRHLVPPQPNETPKRPPQIHPGMAPPPPRPAEGP